MKIVEWDMKETFAFPTSAGMPTGVETVNVTPMFTVNRSDDAVRLSGIYHIAANISLDEEKSRETESKMAILIDDVEVEESAGYFEYAVPFSIDLPPEVKDPLDVKTANALCKIDGQGSFSITWGVECSYLEGIAVKEETVEEEVIVNEKIAVEDKVTETEAAVVNEPIVVEEVIAKEKVVVNETAVVEKEVIAKKEQVAVKEETTVQEASTTVAAATVVDGGTSFSDTDEVLSFIAGLDDGISSTLFRSNDISV